MSKHTFYCILHFCLIVCLTACSKDPVSPTAPPLITTFKFNGNGIAVQWNGTAPLASSAEGSIIQRNSSSSNPAIPVTYFLYARVAAAGLYSPHIHILMQTSNLTAGTYTLTTPSTVLWNLASHFCIMPDGKYYASSNIGDFVTVNIKSIHDGVYADGTFTALLTNSPDGTSNKLSITNGEFQNVKIDQ